MNNSVFADIYKFHSPVPNFVAIELSINRADKKVRAAYFYYANPVTWKSLEEKQRLQETKSGQRETNICLCIPGAHFVSASR